MGVGFGFGWPRVWGVDSSVVFGWVGGWGKVYQNVLVTGVFCPGDVADGLLEV